MDFSTRRITQTLQLLEKQEIRRFSDFLSSPYFTKDKEREQMLQLFQLLAQYLFKKQEFEIPNKKLAETISGTKALHLGKLEKTLSKLNALIFDFLGIDPLLQSKIHHIKTAETLRNRNADNLWHSHIKKTSQLFPSIMENNFDISMQRLLIQNEKFAFKQFPKKTLEIDMTSIIYELNNFYLSNMLHKAIHVLSDNKSFFPPELKEEFKAMDLLLKSEQEFSSEIIVLKMVYELLSKKEIDGTQHLKLIKKNLNLHEDSMAKDSQINISLIILNHAIKMYNLGDLDMGTFIFDMYKQGLEKGWLFHGTKIQIRVVLNIVHCAINEKEFAWAENFIDEIKHQILEQAEKDFAVALVKARILFAKKEFEQALDTLDFNIVNPSLKGLARILEIKILYEIQSTQLEYRMEAFKIYMHRVKKAKVTPWFQEGHNNFIKILISINLPKTDFDAKRIEKIKAKIEATEILAEKRWLLAKITEKATKLK